MNVTTPAYRVTTAAKRKIAATSAKVKANYKAEMDNIMFEKRLVEKLPPDLQDYFQFRPSIVYRQVPTYELQWRFTAVAPAIKKLNQLVQLLSTSWEMQEIIRQKAACVSYLPSDLLRKYEGASYANGNLQVDADDIRITIITWWRVDGQQDYIKFSLQVDLPPKAAYWKARFMGKFNLLTTWVSDSNNSITAVLTNYIGVEPVNVGKFIATAATILETECLRGV